MFSQRLNTLRNSAAGRQRRFFHKSWRLVCCKRPAALRRSVVKMRRCKAHTLAILLVVCTILCCAPAAEANYGNGTGCDGYNPASCATPGPTTNPSDGGTREPNTTSPSRKSPPAPAPPEPSPPPKPSPPPSPQKCTSSKRERALEICPGGNQWDVMNTYTRRNERSRSKYEVHYRSSHHGCLLRVATIRGMPFQYHTVDAAPCPCALDRCY